MNLIEYGRLKKYFDFKICNELNQHRLQVYEGYKVSCDWYDSGLKVLIDTCCKIMSANNLWQDFLDQNIN